MDALSQLPGLPRHLVRRSRLVDLLDEDVPLTALIAPAGSGKSTLLAEWAAQAERPVAWLGGDACAGGPVAFWLAVTAAIERLCGVGATVRQDLLLGRCPVGDAVLHLLNELHGRPLPPGALVVDDFQDVEDDAIDASLSLFLRHLPEPLRVLVATRREPGFPLERMRAGGALVEVRFGELRLSVEESCELLQRLAPSAPDEEIRRAVAVADGWAVALRLAATRMRRSHSQPQGSADPDGDDVIGDYVRREVLAPAPVDAVAVLTDLAVLDRFTLELAATVTERADAASMVQEAEASGLLVNRVGVHGWYEIHSVVRAALLRDRSRHDPARAAAVHRRAAVWYEGTGETLAALDQWLLAGDHREVLRLLAVHHVELYDAGREAAIRDIVDQLAPESTAADPASLLDLGWCQLLISRSAFLDCVDQADWWAANRGLTDPVLRAKLDTLTAISSLVRGDWTTAAERARRGVAALETWWKDPVARTGWNNVGRAIALSERWHDADDEVRELAVTLRREPNRLLVLEATRALGEAMAGRPVDALRVAAGVRASTTIANLAMSRAELALAEAIARREIADGTDIAADLGALVELPLEPMTYVRGIAALELVQLHLDVGDATRAGHALATLETIVRDELTADVGRSMLARMSSAVHLAIGDAHAAASCADEVRDTFWGPVTHADVQLADGNAVGASRALDDAAPRSTRHEVILALRRARAAPDHDTAQLWAGRAITQASAAGLLQTVASERCLQLLEPTAWRVPAAWMDRLRRLAAATRQPGVPSSLHLVEPLTPRERDVLRFLPSRLTLGEIADELYVSVNTLKFHLKVIYRKLGVNSRAEAAEHARSWTHGRSRHE